MLDFILEVVINNYEPVSIAEVSAMVLRISILAAIKIGGLCGYKDHRSLVVLMIKRSRMILEVELSKAQIIIVCIRQYLQINPQPKLSASFKVYIMQNMVG